jgi:hypothetical protein
MSRTSLDAALAYAARGWAVFPCHEPAHGFCSCRRLDCSSPAKHPRTPKGLHDAITDREVITAWWRLWPGANVGVRTGAVSGVVVLDVDVDKGGLATLHDLQRRHATLPPSPAVRTGGGGRHYWFAHPAHSVRNSAGRLGPGLDVRGDGGYVIAPPSRHATGGRYLWASEMPLRPAPDWLVSLFREPVQERPVMLDVHRFPDANRWARAAVEGEITRVQQAADGVRNDTLNRAAFALGQLVGAGHLREDRVRNALVTAGLRVGLSPTEVRATVASGLRAGSRSPRSPSDNRRHRQSHSAEIV